MAVCCSPKVACTFSSFFSVSTTYSGQGWASANGGLNSGWLGGCSHPTSRSSLPWSSVVYWRGGGGVWVNSLFSGLYGFIACHIFFEWIGFAVCFFSDDPIRCKLFASGSLGYLGLLIVLPLFWLLSLWASSLCLPHCASLCPSLLLSVSLAAPLCAPHCLYSSLRPS